MNEKLYKKFRGTKVPRDKTLTAIFDSNLDHLLFHPTII